MRFFASFYGRLSIVFLALIVLLAVLHVTIAADVYDRQRDEVDQRANATLAADMAREIEPQLAGGVDSPDIGSAIHYMMVLNPLIEIYILGEDGRIITFFADSGVPVEMDRVDLNPVVAFLDASRPLPLYGDDPRRPSMKSTFSAARLSTGGYLYVVLRSAVYDSARNAIADTYATAAIRESLLYTIPLVALLGLVTFFLLTRRLQRLTEVVRRFGDGTYDVRAAAPSGDEVGTLAASFNTMAETIQSNLRELERAERDRRELVANISHDLRTPLAAIRGYTETLLEKVEKLDPQERHHYLQVTMGAVESLSGLVDDLFALSRLESPDQRIDAEEFSLSELCQDVAVQISPLAESAEVRITLRNPDGLCLVEADIKMIDRVLTNLVDNALRVAPRGSDIVLSVESGEGVARVSVSDSGPGIEPDRIQRVFDRFYTGDPSRTSGRSGLGLAIARRIVELHGGSISVESSPGEGSTFRFQIPSLQS